MSGRTLGSAGKIAPSLSTKAQRVRAKRELLEEAARQMSRIWRNPLSTGTQRQDALSALAASAKEFAEAEVAP